MKRLVAALALFAGMVSSSHASEPAVPPVHIDDQGVIRWTRGGGEVRLFGANYCAFSGGDYRMAGLVGADRKAMIDEDMAHFARLGWTGLRLCSLYRPGAEGRSRHPVRRNDQRAGASSRGSGGLGGLYRRPD